MCKTEWRKHYRSLKTEEEKEQARAERAKQIAEKTRIISEHQLQQRQDKHKQASSNIATKYGDGKQASSCKCVATKCLPCLHTCLPVVCPCHVDHAGSRCPKQQVRLALQKYDSASAKTAQRISEHGLKQLSIATSKCRPFGCQPGRDMGLH